MKKYLSSHFFYFFVAIIISLPIIFPYFQSGYFPTHDGEWAVVRLSEMYREVIRDHQFPARFSDYLNFGHGYPLFNFAYPFPYYLGLPLVIAGFGFVTTIKILFASSVLLSVLTMYLASFTLWKNRLASFVCALLYAYLPYRMVDLYVRGSLGESIAFVLFPLLLYFIIKISEDKKPFLYSAGFAVTLATLVTTHNIMTVLFAPILLVSIFYYTFFVQRKSLIHYILALVGGVGLSAFFWIPAIFEKNNILLSQVPIADRNLYYVNPLQLLLPSWGYGIPTASDAFTYQLGIPHILLFLVLVGYIIMLLVQKRLWTDKVSHFAATMVVLVISLLVLLFRPSAFIWEHVPLLKEINYPWTMLASLGFLLSFLGGYIATRPGKFKYVALFSILLALVMHFPYAQPPGYVERDEGFYSTNDATTTSSSELMPLWVKSWPNKRPERKVELLDAKGTISDIEFNSKKILFKAHIVESGEVKINTIYYPGWEAKVNGQKQKIAYTHPTGLMHLYLQPGDYTVQFDWTETPLRVAANSMSLITGLGIFVVLLYNTPLTKKSHEN